MGKIAIAIIATILFGYVGIIIGAMLNLGSYQVLFFLLPQWVLSFCILSKARSKPIPIFRAGEIGICGGKGDGKLEQN